MRRILQFLVCMMVISTPQLLQAEENGDIFALPLEQLTSMDYIVQTASKREESISDAPGVVSVITAEDISRFGAKKLSDVLSLFPNVTMWGTEVLQNNVASVRGGSPTHAESHMLFLLNGRPIRDSLAGISIPVYEAIPVDAIHHIEMVRGPGSVLYGSNAFSGVINVITKSPKDIAKNQLTVGGGSFHTRMGSALGAFENKDFSTVAAINLRSSDGWTIPFMDANRVRGGYEHGEEAYGGFLQSRYKNLTFEAFLGDVDSDRLGAAVRFPSIRSHKERQFFDVGYHHDFSEHWVATVNTTINNYYDHVVGLTTEGRLLELVVDGEVGEKGKLTTGLTIENHYAEMDNPSVQSSDEVNWYGYYIQADYNLTEWAKLTGGFQVNKPDEINYDIVPRFGVVMNFTPAWGAKMLYGEAFRSPYAGERVLSFGYLIGNPNLQPETITTVDAQLFYNEGGISSALTAYKSIQEKGIVRLYSVPQTFVNAGNIDYWGIEWEGRANLAKHWDLLGSASYQAGEDEYGNKDIGIVPHILVKMGLSYSSGTGYQIGVFDSYYSEAAKIQEISNAAVINPSADSYHWLTINASLDLEKIMGSPIILNIYGENLLDQEVFFPEVFTREVNSTPMRSGRAGYARVTVKF